MTPKPYNGKSLEDINQIFDKAEDDSGHCSFREARRIAIKAVADACACKTIEIPFDEETLWITGQPSFAIRGIAEGLRKLGIEIKYKSEDEQAHVAIWALNLYLKHGKDKWREEAVKLIQSTKALPPSPQAGGENE